MGNCVVCIETVVLGVLQTWAEENAARIFPIRSLPKLKPETPLGNIPTDRESWLELCLDMSDQFPGIVLNSDTTRLWKTVGDVVGGVREAIDRMSPYQRQRYGTLSKGRIIWNATPEVGPRA